MRTPVIIVGTGSLARILAHWIDASTDSYVKGFTVDQEFFSQSEFCGKPVYPYQKIDQIIVDAKLQFLIAVGYANMRRREELFHRLKQDGRSFYSYISPEACVDKSVYLGENSIVFPAVVIEPFCQIGHHNIFWSSAVICHDSQIGHHNFFAAHTVLGGECHVGDRCFFGFSSVVTQQITVADETLLGANSLLLESSDAGCRYIGTPARFVCEHKTGGICL